MAVNKNEEEWGEKKINNTPPPKNGKTYDSKIILSKM